MIHRYKIILLLLISIKGFFLYGQSSDLILTKEQNEKWFDSLETLRLDNKLDLIKTRILIDTIVYNSNQHRSDRVILENVKKEEKLKSFGNVAEGRIMYFVRYKRPLVKKYDFVGFEWHNWTSPTQIKEFYNFINADKFDSIEIITDKDDERALFGSMSGFGIIIFDLSRKQYLKEFKNIIND